MPFSLAHLAVVCVRHYTSAGLIELLLRGKTMIYGGYTGSSF